MKRKVSVILLVLTGLFFSSGLKSQNRPIDHLNATEHFGVTTMFRYSYRNWIAGDKAEKGSLNFDSFRLWAQTDVNKKVFAAVQFRFYEGWQTPTHLFVGWHVDKKNTIQLGQTWVPFGIGYQPYDDWGNIAFYVGLQDDYDYGITWEGNYGLFKFNAGFFKNQQLSSSSPFRYDADIFSGGMSDDYLITTQKSNEEVNQLNLRLEVLPSGDNWNASFGLSGMAGQIYNKTTDDNGTRYAAAVHAGIDFKNFHFNVQQTWYNYTQALPDSATQDQKDFINVSSWAFAYEIPVQASIFTTAAQYNIIGDKLSVYGSYSYLWGGTSQAESQLLTFGVSSLWERFDIYAEGYYGANDPQLSGSTTGYGRNSSSYDFRFDIRFFYKLSIVSDKTIKKLKEMLKKE